MRPHVCGTLLAAYPVPGPIDVVGHDSPGGAIDDDLRAACLAALDKPRDGVRRHAEQFNWPTATRQFEQALVRIGRASRVADEQPTRRLIGMNTFERKGRRDFAKKRKNF